MQPSPLSDLRSGGRGRGGAGGRAGKGEEGEGQGEGQERKRRGRGSSKEREDDVLHDDNLKVPITALPLGHVFKGYTRVHVRTFKGVNSLLDYSIGVGFGNLFNVHPSLSTCHDNRTHANTVHHYGNVVFMLRMEQFHQQHLQCVCVCVCMLHGEWVTVQGNRCSYQASTPHVAVQHSTSN